MISYCILLPEKGNRIIVFIKEEISKTVKTNNVYNISQQQFSALVSEIFRNICFLIQ
jgi:hypothetical protein